MKRPKNITVSLTPAQLELILWCIDAGHDQFRKHLMHDGWDDDQTFMEKRRVRRLANRFARAFRMLQRKAK